MKASTAVAAGTLVALGVGAAIALGHNKEVAIHLKDVGGVCTPDEPDVMSAGWKNKVKWKVYNDSCADPQYISLRDFKPRDGGSLGDPVVITDPYPVKGGPVAQGGGPVDLDAKVEKFEFFKKRYKYAIYLGTTEANVTSRLDPDIDVWPF